MSKKYIPTAKDKAHAAEIAKLQHQLREECDKSRRLAQAWQSAKDENGKLRATIRMYEEKTGMSADELRDHVERTKKLHGMLDFMMNGGHYYG